MHIFFSGIGGTGIGPLAQIAQQAGYEVSGSDEKDSQYIDYLRQHGVADIHIGQTRPQLADVHARKPVDWFVYSSAVSKDSQELDFCRENNIKHSKRDELLNKIIADKGLKLVAVAGTHGKTTTTAMIVWLFKQLELSVSYSVGAKINFGNMGAYVQDSEYFVYEADEFDRNFLAFKPYFTTITGVSWDHHEVYPTQDDYLEAFRQFLEQSTWRTLWKKDQALLNLADNGHLALLDENDPHINEIKLLGWHNRANGWQAAQAVHAFTKQPLDKILACLSIFPGVSRRFEKIVTNLYTDYAHTPEKIIGAMGVAKEAVARSGQKIVVVYEPLTNRRMHHTRDRHKDIFSGASAIYWVPSYLAREDPGQPVLTPEELIKSLNPGLQAVAQPAKLDQALKGTLQTHLDSGHLVLCLSGGGGDSLDEWLRKEFGH